MNFKSIYMMLCASALLLSCSRIESGLVTEEEVKLPSLSEDVVMGELLVRFDEAVRAPAPGQTAAFYDGDRLLGGGFIVK